jgi:PncC family amidohydrolase
MTKSQPVEAKIGKLLRQKNLKLVLAESCSGGLISHLITNIPGSSEYFLGSLVTYSNEAKVEWLRVNPGILRTHGSVSRETALAMALGARESMAQVFPREKIIALAITGIAGPGGGTTEKPVGLVWIGLSAAEREDAWSFQWTGSREENKLSSAQAGLQILLDYLNSL